MISPIISVVMSVYNGDLYLSESIDSILNQTYKNFEFIIINDGSTDNSLKIISVYAKQDARIIVISRENKGLISSLNEGLALAKGKYIARMDADDISLPTRFEEQVNFLDTNPQIGACGSWIEVFGTNIKTYIDKYPITNDEHKIRLLFSPSIAHPSAMIRRYIIAKFHLEYDKQYKHAEDYMFWMQFSKYAELANIPKVLFKYRYLETGVTRVANNVKDNTRYQIIKSIFRKLLINLCIKNSEEEDRLHFIIGGGRNRMLKHEINLYFLNQYLIKIIRHNKKENLFNEKYLRRFLGIKFVVAAYSQVRRGNYQITNILTSMLFYIGIKQILSNKLLGI